MILKDKLAQIQKSVNPILVIHESYVPNAVKQLLSYKGYFDEIGWKVIPVVIYKKSGEKKFKKHPVVSEGFKVDWSEENLTERIKRIVKGISRDGSPVEAYLGFGLLTGKENGITAIDFDSIPKWEEFQQVFKGKTLVQKTNNGYHVFFKYVPEAKNGTAKGVDVRNDNGFVVTLPAMGYSFIIPDAEDVIAEADENVVSFLKKENLLKNTEEKKKSSLSKEKPVSEDGIKGIKNVPLFIEAVKQAYRDGEVNGYDVDLLISALAKRGIPASTLEKIASEVFGRDYDERRTAYMIERGIMLPRIRDVGSFVFKLSPETKAKFLKALGTKPSKIFTRKKVYSGKIVERYIRFAKEKYCKFLSCLGNEVVVSGESLTVKFTFEEIGEILPDDYYQIYVYREKISLPKEIEVNGERRTSLIYPAHVFVVGERSTFSLRVTAEVTVGKSSYVHYPVKEKGKESRFTVLTDRLDEFPKIEDDFPVKVVYTPFPEYLIEEHKGVVFAASSVSRAVKTPHFSKVLGVVDSLEDVKAVIDRKKKFKNPLDVGVKFFKEELKEILEWIKFTVDVPPCVERFLDNLEKDRNPYRIQTLLSFFKKFASDIYRDYMWVIKELLDVAVKITEKDGKVTKKSAELTLPPFFPCVAYSRDYCSYSSWKECSCQKFGDVYGVEVESLSVRENSVTFSLNVVGQGEVKKTVQRGLEIDRIIRKVGAMVEPNLLKYYKPLLELEVSRALSEAKDVLYPQNIKGKILHFTKESFCTLVVEGRFAVREENGKKVFYFPVTHLKNVVKSHFERPIAPKVSYEEIDYVIDEHLGSFIVEGQIRLYKGKVRKAYRLPVEMLYWFLEEVEAPQTPEYYTQRFEIALEIAEEKLDEWEKKEKLAMENYGVTEDVIEKMEEDPFFKEESRKAVRKKITGEETPEDRFESLFPSDDVKVILRWEPDEVDLPEDVLKDFGIENPTADNEDWNLKVGESRQDGKVKVTRIDEYTLLYEKGEKKAYVTRKYERFIELNEELEQKYGHDYVPVLVDNEDFLFYILDNVLGVNVSRDEIKFRIPEEVNENKKEKLYRETIRLLIKKMGLEKYEKMFIRSQLGDNSWVKKAAEEARKIYKELKEKEEKKVEEKLEGEEKELLEDLAEEFGD